MTSDDRSGADGRKLTAQTPLDWPRAADAVPEVMDVIVSEVRRRRRRRQRFSACGLVATIVLVAGLSFRSESFVAAPLAESPRMAILQPHRETLPDGSVVELTEMAEIAVEFSPTIRRVALLRGEAFFQVARDVERPFVVSAGGVGVRAVGTAFSVRMDSGEVDVVVTHGRVSVGADDGTAGQVFLNPGQRTVVAREADRPLEITDVTAELGMRLSWRVPRLQLKETPLSEVIAVFNGQPGAVPLLLGDPRLGSLPLSGVLRADNLGVLLSLLEISYGVDAVAGVDGWVLSRREAASR